MNTVIKSLLLNGIVAALLSATNNALGMKNPELELPLSEYAHIHQDNIYDWKPSLTNATNTHRLDVKHKDSLISSIKRSCDEHEIAIDKCYMGILVQRGNQHFVKVFCVGNYQDLEKKFLVPIIIDDVHLDRIVSHFDRKVSNLKSLYELWPTNFLATQKINDTTHNVYLIMNTEEAIEKGKRKREKLSKEMTNTATQPKNDQEISKRIGLLTTNNDEKLDESARIKKQEKTGFFNFSGPTIFIGSGIFLAAIIYFVYRK